MTDRAEEIAREHVEQWWQEGTIPVCHNEKLEHYVANLLRAYGREVREACADEIRDEFDIDWRLGTAENILLIETRIRALPLPGEKP